MKICIKIVRLIKNSYFIDFSRLPEEVYDEIFNWCSRVELGKHVSLANAQFHLIAHRFMHVKRIYYLPNFYFRPNCFGKGQIFREVLSSDGNENWTPVETIPTLEIPNNITGWKGELKIE